MKMKIMFILNASLIVLLAGACSMLNQTPKQPAPTPTAVVMPTTGMQYYFVTSKLLVPTTQEQIQTFSLNVDEDSQKKPDNKFGELITLLTTAAPTLELQSTLDQAVTTGQVVSLHLVQADDFMNDQNVSWSIFLGQKTQAAPVFDGTDKFTLDSATPNNSPIIGALTNGHFVGGPGKAQIQILLLGEQVEVRLIGVRLEADFSTSGCVDGKIGGGITVDEFRSNLLPAIADGLNQMIKADKGSTNTLLQAFDADNNGSITTQELENNPLLMLAVSPDLDLLDASGNFNPNQDGVKDSYSVGLGFTCVPATFTAPEK